MLAVAVGLIALGNRNDAASEGERLKAGLLTAHEVRMAFQTVGGRLVDRPIEEGVTVEAGQKLLALDPTDVMLEIESTEAKIRRRTTRSLMKRRASRWRSPARTRPKRRSGVRSKLRKRTAGARRPR